MEAFPGELCLDLNTFWSISMVYEHLALSTNIWMTAQYLKYATKAEYLSYMIQLTLLRSCVVIMICALMRVRQKWFMFV